MGNVIGSVFSGASQALGAVLGHPLDFLSGASCDSVCDPTWDLLCYIDNFCISHLLKLAMVAVLVYFVLLFFFLVYKLGICQCLCRNSCRLSWACFATCFSALDFCCTYLWYKLRSVKRERRRRKRDIELAVVSSSSSDNDDDLEEFAFKQPRNGKSRRIQSKRRRHNKGERSMRFLMPKSAHVKVARLHSINRKHRRRRKKDIKSAAVSSDSESDLEESALEQPKNAESMRMRSNKRRSFNKEERLRRSLRPNSHRAHVSFARNPIHMHRRTNMVNDDVHISDLHHHVTVGRSSRFAKKGSWPRTGIHKSRRQTLVKFEKNCVSPQHQESPPI